MGMNGRCTGRCNRDYSCKSDYSRRILCNRDRDSFTGVIASLFYQWMDETRTRAAESPLATIQNRSHHCMHLRTSFFQTGS